MKDFILIFGHRINIDAIKLYKPLDDQFYSYSDPPKYRIHIEFKNNSPILDFPFKTEKERNSIISKLDSLLLID